MRREAVFEANIPAAIRRTDDDLIGNDEFLLGTRPDKQEPSPTRDVEYAFIFNRITRSWFKPIRLPFPYDTSPGKLVFHLAGFASSKTFVLFCSDMTVEYLAFLHINADCSGISVMRNVTLTSSADPNFYSHCIAFSRTSTTTFRLMCESGENIFTVYACVNAASSAELCRVHLDDNRSCIDACSYSDQFYLYCEDMSDDEDDDSMGYIYRLENNRLQLLTVFDCAALTPRVFDGDDETYFCSATESHLFVTIFFSSSYAVTAVLDLRTKQWSTSEIACDIALPPSGTLPSVRDGLAHGEMIIPAISVTPLAWLPLFVPREKFLVRCALPRKLSALSLHAVHRHLPRDARASLAERAATIGDIPTIVRFLYTMDVPDTPVCRPTFYRSWFAEYYVTPEFWSLLEIILFTIFALCILYCCKNMGLAMYLRKEQTYFLVMPE